MKGAGVLAIVQSKYGFPRVESLGKLKVFGWTAPKIMSEPAEGRSFSMKFMERRISKIKKLDLSDSDLRRFLTSHEDFLFDLVLG